MMLHPWVAFAVMPVFALANAGVQFGGVDLSAMGPATVASGIMLALLLGKPALTEKDYEKAEALIVRLVLSGLGLVNTVPAQE